MSNGYKTGGPIARLCPQATMTTASDCGDGGLGFQVFMMEMCATFVFVSVILQVKNISGSKTDALNAAAISMTLWGMILMIGGYTGGAINPAVGLIQSIYQSMTISLSLKSMLLYVLGPCAGGVLAGFFGKLNQKVEAGGDLKVSVNVN